MNILVIGNGFDLAHGLPTTYKEFLYFTTIFQECFDKGKNEEKDWVSGDNIEVKMYLRTLFDKANDTTNTIEQETATSIVNELDDLVKNNVWLRHFKQVQIKEGWIDFESEISRIIQCLDKARKTLEAQFLQGIIPAKINQKELNILSPLINEDGSLLKADLIAFYPGVIGCQKTQFLKDLNKLIRCLEIYLCDYVGNMEVIKTLPDIEALPLLDKVLSFNYTNTHEKLYVKNPTIEYDYIHGRAKIDNTVESNNMVLGIDEYLRGDEKNTNVEMIEFKKFYQRIHKETGCLYRNWVDDIKNIKKIQEKTAVYKEEGNTVVESKYVNFHKVFFFGHSLDVTDKDVIRDLILNDNVKTTIFYRNKADYGQKITNLVRIIGQDELIKRTGGNDKSIFFKAIIEE